MKIKVALLIGLAGFLLISIETHAQAGGSWTQKYEGRKNSRFDLISFLSEQRKIRSEQNSRLSAGGYFKLFTPDIAMEGWMSNAQVKRAGSELGSGQFTGGRLQFLMNNLFSQGTSRRLINIDIGFEGFYDDFSSWKPATGSSVTAARALYSGGGLLIRPFGRSSQDNGMLFKIGSGKVSSTGLLGSSVDTDINDIYYGGEARLYLLPILGIKGEYLRTNGAKNTNLGGALIMTDIRYGAFLEFYLLQLGAHVHTREWSVDLDAGGNIKDTQSGLLFTVGLFF